MSRFTKSIATIRGDLSNITAPPFVLDTKSTVELPSFWAERPATLVAPAAADDPAERALLVLKWFLASLRNQQYGGRSPAEGVKKPINAFLGELFLARWDGDQGEDGDRERIGVTRLVSEQVSHHPPVTACRVWNEKHGVTAEGYTRQEITFSGSVNIQQTGHATLHLARHDETYLIPLPDIKIRGVLTGSPYPELQGTHHIPSTSGYTSTIDFSGRGLFSGSDRKHSFEARVYRDAGGGGGTGSDGGDDRDDGPIYTVSGHWDGQFVIRDARGQENVELETFDVTTATTTPLVTDPLAEQDPWESRRAWRGVREALQRGDMQAAADAKAKVENGQREMRKADNGGKAWKHVFFEPVSSSGVDEVAASLARKVGIVLGPAEEKVATAWRFRREEWEGGRFQKPYHGNLVPDNSQADAGSISTKDGEGGGGGNGDGTVVNHIDGVPPSPVADSRSMPSEADADADADAEDEDERHGPPKQPAAQEEKKDIDEQEDMTARDKAQVEEFLRDRYSSRKR